MLKVTVEAELLVFKPKVNSVVDGWLKEWTQDGLTVTLGNNLCDIHIPGPSGMIENSIFDTSAGQWKWVEVPGKQEHGYEQ